MVTGTSIATKTIRILSYLDNTAQPESVNTDDDVLSALYQMHKLSPSYAVITCPVKHYHFFYISENCMSIFGYSAEHMAKHFKDLPDYFSQIHQADIAHLQDCMNYLESFIQGESPEDYHKLRAVLHYRFLNAEGRYVYLQDEKATLITESGKIVHYSLVRNMGNELPFTGTKIEVYKLDKKMLKLGEYKPLATKNTLSAREKDLILLIKTGLTTKEIAWQLNISHNTVRNIKSKLFEKYQVNSTIALLNMTG